MGMDWIHEAEHERRRWVYFIKEAKARYVKVGCTAKADPVCRFIDLAQANPRRLEIIGLVPCGGGQEMLDTERGFHDAFAKYRVHREWYRLPTSEINGIRQGYGLAVTPDMVSRVDRYYANRGGTAHLLVPERIALIGWRPVDTGGGNGGGDDRLDHAAAVLGLPEQIAQLEF